MIIQLTRDEIASVIDYFFPYMEMLVKTKINDAFTFTQFNNKSKQVCDEKLYWFLLKEIIATFKEARAKKTRSSFIKLSSAETIVFYQLLTQLPIKDHAEYLIGIRDKLTKDFEETEIDPGE